MKKIASVTVHLDQEVPEYMHGVLRCAEVTSEDEEGNEQDHPELIDNAEFASEDALKAHVAERLGVSPDVVDIED